jgi:hypothetical protein
MSFPPWADVDDGPKRRHPRIDDWVHGRKGAGLELAVTEAAVEQVTKPELERHPAPCPKNPEPCPNKNEDCLPNLRKKDVSKDVMGDDARVEGPEGDDAREPQMHQL